MASSITKIFITILSFILISQGYSQCSLKDIHITQSQTGAEVQGKTEWLVTITNWCACYQSNVKLNCKGFQTVKQIDPQLLKITDGVCLVSAGQPIFRGATEFTYAWDNPFTFNPISSNISCS